MLKKNTNEFLRFHCNNCQVNAPQRDVIRTLRILLKQFCIVPFLMFLTLYVIFNFIFTEIIKNRKP